MVLLVEGQAKFPFTVFKGVTDCFQLHKKYLSPTMGLALLEGGVIGDIRFYGDFNPAYRDTNGKEERDYAQDHSKDPIWQLVHLLFPSSGGQLSADSTHSYNFGKYVKNPKTVALLINYADDVRFNKPVDEEKLQNDIIASFGIAGGEKISDGDKLLMEDIMQTVRLSIRIYGNKATHQKAMDENLWTVTRQQALGKAKSDLLQRLTRMIKRLSNPNVKTIFMNKISALYPLGSHLKPKYESERTPLKVVPQFFHEVAAMMAKAQEEARQAVENMPTKDQALFKKNIITPLLKAIKGAVDSRDGFYTLHLPDQVILAFLCYKFSTRADIKEFLIHLKPEIINQQAVAEFDATDLLKTEDLPQIALKENYSPDDVMALATADTWSMPTPYRVGAAILSNGNTKKYDRKNNVFLTDEFADCVEISIRHLLNCFLFNPISRQFDFSGLLKYRKNNQGASEQDPYFASLINFYKIQFPELANDGNIHMRSEWNRVVGDLNAPNEPIERKIRYHQETNELDAGFINLMNVIQKITGVQINPAPLSTYTSFEEKKAWLENAFYDVFEALNPNKGYTIALNMDRVVDSGSELSGIVIVTVSHNNRLLYSFGFRSDPDAHGELQNYQVSDRSKIENYLPALEESFVRQKSADSPVWILVNDKNFRNKNLNSLYPFYQLFNESLFDTKAKSRFLKKLGRIFEEQENFTFNHKLQRILSNIISDINLDDGITVEKIAPDLLALIEHEGAKEIIYHQLKTRKFVANFNNYGKIMPTTLSLIKIILQLNKPNFTHLSIYKGQVDDDGAKELATGLEKNSTLTSLNLRDNSIKDKGAIVLAQAIAKNRTLNDLNLIENRIGDTGAKALAKGVEENTTLTNLKLEFNPIRDAGVMAFIKVLENKIPCPMVTFSSEKVDPVLSKKLKQIVYGPISKDH